MAQGKSKKMPTSWDVSRFHLVDSLNLNVSLASAPEMEAALVGEGLLRGADELDLISRLSRRRERIRASSGIAPPSSFGIHLEPLRGPDGDSLVGLVSRLTTSYREMAKKEFDALPADVRVSFGYGGNQPFQYYLAMRAALYQVGYNDPAGDVFARIRPAKLLGHTIIGGAHELFLEQLGPLTAQLDRWSPGLAARMDREITQVGGFVPRYIAPAKGAALRAPVLSNHAFGLAVDIDPKLNPHIKERDVIEALKLATGYDFGAEFVGEVKGIPGMDRVAQIHMLEQDASVRLQRWLQSYLPLYLDAERTGALQSSFADPDQERNLRLIARLRRFVTAADLESWKNKGIQSIPLYLAAAMAALKFRWGATYEHSKDVMHFELLAEKVIPPQSGSRPLEKWLQAIHPHA